MKQGLSLRVSQHLALTPQLQQSIRLLQLSTLELNQEIEQMLDENPFLEKDFEEIPREEFGLEKSDSPIQKDDEAVESSDTWDNPLDRVTEIRVDTPASDTTPEADGIAESWDGDGSVDFAVDDTEWGGDAPAKKNNNDREDVAEASEFARSQESLSDFLHRQALSLRLDEVDKAALRFLIESLNDDGYLEDTLRSLAEGLAGEDLEQVEELEHRFEVAKRLLQSLEPTGVGASNLSECLSLQIKAMVAPNNQAQVIIDTALAIAQQSLDLLAKRDYKRMALAVSETEERVKLAMALIARLEPKPGRRFVDVERNVIVPDVFVLHQGVDKTGAPKFRVQLNPEVMPKLRVNDIYANALKSSGKGESQSGLQQRLQEARWMIKNIQQRFETILRVSDAIAQRQKNFFVHGELAMKPMVLREIADELGLHESTISRVTTSKYISTPMGTFELKYFFGSGLGTESGNNASSTAVRALIKQFIASENPKKPLSDNQLSDMLKEQGIDCARRTVAKYREALRIAPTNLRKTL